MAWSLSESESSSSSSSPTSTSSTLPKEEKILRLESNDGECFDITESEASLSVLLRNVISSSEDNITDYYSTEQISPPPTNDGDTGASASGNKDQYNSVILSNTNGRILASVTGYLRIHSDNRVSEEEKDDYDLDEIIDSKTLDELLSIFQTADYLEIKGLFDVAAKGIAERIKDFSVDKFRDVFHIQNDFTPEEEELIRQEHPWAHVI